LGIEKQAPVIILEERGCLALNNSTVSARIRDEVVIGPKLAEGKVTCGETEGEGALTNRGGTFHVYDG
jgi:hypothetical protein